MMKKMGTKSGAAAMKAMLGGGMGGPGGMGGMPSAEQMQQLSQQMGKSGNPLGGLGNGKLPNPFGGGLPGLGGFPGRKK